MNLYSVCWINVPDPLSFEKTGVPTKTIDAAEMYEQAGAGALHSQAKQAREEMIAQAKTVAHLS